MINVSFEIKITWQVEIYCESWPIPGHHWLPLAGHLYVDELDAICFLNTTTTWNDYYRLVKIQTITMVDEVIRLKDRRT